MSVIGSDEVHYTTGRRGRKEPCEVSNIHEGRGKIRPMGTDGMVLSFELAL